MDNLLSYKLLILTDNDYSPNNNIKTVTINSKHPLADINVIYENYSFKINDKIIYEKYLNEICFINSQSYCSTNIIPYFFNNIYFKLAYVLTIIGYTNISILNLKQVDVDIYYSNIIPNNSQSIFDIIDIYESKSFGEYMAKIDFALINDNMCYANNIQRKDLQENIINSGSTLYNYIFDNEKNVKFIKKYYSIISKPIKTPEYMLTNNYKYVYSDFIDSVFINKCNYSFLDLSDNIPINMTDYNYLLKCYKFNRKLYLKLNPDLNMYDNMMLFIHFLTKEKNKHIFDLPENFDFDTYVKLNPDVKSLNNDRDILKHFIEQGIRENRNIYDLHTNFNWKLYVDLNELSISNKYEAENHYLTFGKEANLLTSELIPLNFDIQKYVKNNPSLKGLSDIRILKHYVQNINNQGLLLPSGFNAKEYLDTNPDLNITDKHATNHFINYGIYENRETKIKPVLFSKKILVLCHIGNIITFKKMEHYIQNAIDASDENCKIHVVFNIINTIDEIDKKYIETKYPDSEIKVNDNFGFDIGSFFMYLKKCKELNIDYDYIFKIHTKTSDIERENLIKPLLGSINRIKLIIEMLNNNKIGLIGSKRCMYYNYDKLSIHNQNHLIYLLNKYNLDIPHHKMVQFIGGTIFCIRFDILKHVFWKYNFNDILNELNNDTSFDWNWYIHANRGVMSEITNITNKEDAYKHYIDVGIKNNLSGNLFHALKYNTKSDKLRDAMIEHAYERLFSYIIENNALEQIFLPYESYTYIHNIKPVPIIFPQYHPIPENDKFWGENFTEWTLLNKIETNYIDNKLEKPHESLGQYNILSKEHIKFTENIFGKYLDNTACYYHYWFNGHKVMYKPIEKIRDENKPNIKYALIWANETWSSRWDGLQNNILLKQDYGIEKNWIKHIEYLITFFKSDNYIIINNKPLFFIYRPLDMPYEIFQNMIKIFNNHVIKHGFDGLNTIIFYNNTTDINSYEQYKNNQFVNGVMDFNPNYTNTKAFTQYQEIDEDSLIFEKINNIPIYNEKKYLAYNIDVQNAVNSKQINNGYVHYKNLSEQEKKSRIYKSSLGNIIPCYDYIEKEPKKHKVQLYSTFMGWDNSPRRNINKMGMKPTIFLGSSPYLFKKHIKNMIMKIIKNPNTDINWLIINAYNEWNEQTCLEPSDKYGYKYLEAIKSVFNEYY